jgi:hypothetical protein
MATLEQTGQAATHEAGHCVAAQRYSWGIRWVSCLPDEKRKGGSSLVPRVGEPVVVAIESIVISLVADLVVREIGGIVEPETLGMERYKPSRDEALQEFELLASGPVYRGYVDCSDLKRAEQAARDITHTPEQADALFEYGHRCAVDLACDPGYQLEVAVLAHRLAERGELNGLQSVAEILKAQTMFETYDERGTGETTQRRT